MNILKKLFSQAGKAKDPVCGMSVDAKSAKFKSIYQEKEYFFCSGNCKTQFDQTPMQFI